MNSTDGGSNPPSGRCPTRPRKKASAMPMTSTASTAPNGLMRRATRKISTSGSTSSGSACPAVNTAVQKRNSTPASMAAAMATGRRCTSAPSGLTAAVTRMSAPASRKAPTAVSITSPCEPAMSAAPGVDQAVMIGMRWRQPRKALLAAMDRQRPMTAEEVCAGVAPTACDAATMRARVPPKPTRAATTAEVTIEERIVNFTAGGAGDRLVPRLGGRVTRGGRWG